ncbi:PUA-like domain-containing protein [Collybia nuda]|uniref:PUA-like domain-containing protein n=1 Tax=Collybia nuda TaxID=64659 RepID=A0A9P5XY53_9AGAR|nr:PUA-like domain-containing protein [Collybia nuda]
MSLSPYEIKRLQNIARNEALLKSIGLDTPLFEPKEVLRKAISLSKKRKASNEPGAEQVAKVARPNPTFATNVSVRRSSRNAGKTVDYVSEQQRKDHLRTFYLGGTTVTEVEGSLGREGGIRKHDPKTYGSIPAVQVGTWWESREGCSGDSIHAPWVAGISCGPQGAYSVALSGGYEDDVDLGYAFTYTGSGGRNLKGTKEAPKNLRTAPQSSDQTFDSPFNKSLKLSTETKKPVRVIRGFKSKSKYAPTEGYRYDGLYTVEQAWMEKGLNSKYSVCKFAFKRIPGQPALPIRGDHDEKHRFELADAVERDEIDNGQPPTP